MTKVHCSCWLSNIGTVVPSKLERAIETKVGKVSSNKYYCSWEIIHIRHRPSNPHGLTVRLTVWDANSRSHGFAS